MKPNRGALIPVVFLGLLLSGCNPTTSTGGSSQGGSGASGGLTCDGVTTGGFELFVDPRLTVSPSVKIAPLTKSGEKIEFTDSKFEDGTTYTYDLAYVNKGQAFAQGGSIFFDSEGSPGFDQGNGKFQIEGPLSQSTADGGPYAGILTVIATVNGQSTTLANICVALAKE
ncbi:MAG: hypothetical protein IT191_06180 [Microbacteriaceae bacterium]|nr:hypothetical protein [Cryobacterium sp.]MCC6376589.1 hypothetical protein [Microbacteriaceae bacterium]